MDLQNIKKLVKIVNDSQIAEIEIEEEGQRIRITRSVGIPVAMAAPAPQVIQQLPAAVAEVAVQHEAAAPAAPAPAAAAEESLYHEVKSPIVGTFYRASSPDADPYVKVGAAVSNGSTLCIIEAMKIMNEIESDVSGTIVKILVEDAQPVEYDQPLFLERGPVGIRGPAFPVAFGQ